MCDKHPAFAASRTDKPIYCADHKKDGFVNVISSMCESCPKVASYGFPDSKTRFCCDHKLPGMYMTKAKLCKTALCYVAAKNKAFKGYCYRCFINEFPDNNIVKNHKTKERMVADHLRTVFPDFTLTFDRCIEGGCSRRRPDVFIDFGEYVVIIEIDENQHTVYDCSCENRRLMELFQDAGRRPLTMIRFNPDKYTTASKNKIDSCFAYTPQQGLCVVSPHMQDEWIFRLQTLVTAINFVTTQTGQRKEIDVVHLFYDDFNI
jgi:hypothetical protein